ncbi:RDD domain-containing protein [Nocardioides sp. PD653]|nr:RDD domain-containing protein [Nocardioides sp. PD653-B2]GAW56609.1 RDD domain-containing protein [Nocardioides sp. PD653]
MGTYAGAVTAPPSSVELETASWGRRMLALAVDWFGSILVVSLFTPVFGTTGGPGSFFVLVVFVVESAILTATVGGSFGKMLTRLRVVRVADGGRVDPLRSLARAVAVALVIPPLVYRPDRRGLHDVIAGSATVTLETLRTPAA